MSGIQNLTSAIISLQVSVSEVTPGKLGSGFYSLQGLAYYTWLGAWTGKHRLISPQQGKETAR